MRIAYPLKTIEHRGYEQAALMVAAEVSSANAQQVVIGLPLRSDGSEGEAARSVRRFAAMVEASSTVPVVLWDERLSTAAAERHLSSARIFGKKRRSVVDQAAATLILQSYLDAIGKSAWVEEEILQIGPAVKSDRRRRGRSAGEKRWRERRK